MKHLTKLFRATIAIAIMFCVALPTFAHDFEVNGIYYNYLDETAKTVEVTYKGSFSSSYSNEYTGAVTIPSSVTYNSTTYSVTTIGDDAFWGCIDLTSVTIGNSVTTIGDYAFSGCSGLTSVTIPNSVTSIGSGAFSDCSGLTEVNITDLSAWCKIDFDYYNSNPLYYAKKLKLNGTEIKELVIPNDITEIKDYAFSECSGLTSVTIPNSVTSIGDEAFRGCRGLTSVTIPNSVTTIGSIVFFGCSMLTSVTIPNSVTSIGSYVFDNTGWYNNQPYGILYLDNCCLGYKGINPTGTLSIKEGTRLIGGSAFSGCSGLTSITIPNSVTTIGYSAFSGCSGLTSVTIPNSVTKIGNSAFSGCSGLTSVTIGNSVTTIGSDAFSGCSGLNELFIADGTASISGLSFPSSPITTLYLGRNTSEVFMKKQTSLKKLTIGNSVTSICDNAFSGCTGLTEVNFNAENCTSMGSSSYPVFSGCSNLKTLNIGNYVKTIPNSAFSGCTGLTEVTIPSSVTSIGDKAFWGCNKLISSEIIDKTQTTVSIALATPTKYQTGITTNENEKIISESNNIFIKGLKPNTKYTYNSNLIFNGIFCDINSFSFTTNNLVIKNTDIIGVTSASSKAYCEGDVSVIECGINWGNSSVEYNNLDSISAYNLDPNTTYYVYYFLNTKEGGEYSTSWSIRTKILSWNAGEFTATSTTSARLSVETNCDATEGTGYEWVRYDAPDNLTPNKAPCPIVNGMLRGSLRGLNSNVYYKCRPYYTSSSGKTHYGAWFTIFTGDANVYFDPEVSTSDNTVVDNTAIINGYALAGSDDILEQGFEYWNASATPSAEGSMGIMTVKASGISMSATITNLNYNSTYRYRAFAKTANGIFYGSEKEFTTSNDPLGIEDVEVDDNAVEVARYDIHGRLLSKPARGFNIVIYSDGTTRKEIVK